MCLVLCHDPCARCHALQVIKGLGLFGGAGALDAALSEVPTKEARIEFKWYNDINPAACATVEANYPHIHVSAATTSLKQTMTTKHHSYSPSSSTGLRQAHSVPTVWVPELLQMIVDKPDRILEKPPHSFSLSLQHRKSAAQI